MVVQSVMDVADLNHDGTISQFEMMMVSYVAIDLLDHVHTAEELKVVQEAVAKVFCG